jgi:hypothetical protein
MLSTSPEHIAFCKSYPLLFHITSNANAEKIITSGRITPAIPHKNESSRNDAQWEAMTSVYPTGPIVQRLCWFFPRTLAQLKGFNTPEWGETTFVLDTALALGSISDFVPGVVIGLDKTHCVVGRNADEIAKENPGLVRLLGLSFSTQQQQLPWEVPYVVKYATESSSRGTALVTSHDIHITAKTVVHIITESKTVKMSFQKNFTNF